uniref:phenylalanine--tRNA ligase n=1 Tax=Candidatus Methanomethylicus mesodigestus TaxID=1867258 RepID=A0A7C3FBA3_9CREN
MSLSQSEAALLDHLRKAGGRSEARSLASISSIPESSIFPIASLLASKGYITIKELIKEEVALTDEGKFCAQNGLPEVRLVALLKSMGGRAPMSSIAGALKPDEISAALGWGKKTGSFTVEKGPKGNEIVLKKEVPSEANALLGRLLYPLDASTISDEGRSILMQLKSRGLLDIKEAKTLILELVPGKQPAGVLLNTMTSDIIRSGKWREARLRPYDVTASPPKMALGKKHPYLEFLDEVRLILVGMGFEEATCNVVETEFWNFDILFQAQDHPARAVHDSFRVKGLQPQVGAGRDLLDAVRRVHEDGWETGSRGWGYKWSEETASRGMLRSQMTVGSVKYLYSHRKPPVKAFSLSKVFRPDVIDSRHMIEFSQLDGIVGGEGINVRHLLGVLTEFGKKLGFTDIKFKPSYYPFTEPSIDAFVKHPKLGWIECLGAGLFRPEVLKPLGIGFPVIAWGIGIDRLAMIRLGISDIRELHSADLEVLRSWGWW